MIPEIYFILMVFFAVIMTFLALIISDRVGMYIGIFGGIFTFILALAIQIDGEIITGTYVDSSNVVHFICSGSVGCVTPNVYPINLILIIIGIFEILIGMTKKYD